MKSLYVPFMEKEEGRKALDAAIALGTAFASKICATYVQPHPNATLPYGMEPMMVAYVNDTTDKLIEAGRKYEQDLRAAFEKACADRSVKVLTDDEVGDPGTLCATWDTYLGIPDRDYGRGGRGHDLSIVLQNEDDVGVRSDVLEALVFRSGRPALIVPHEGRIDVAGSALVAWNGSVEAARAVGGALPLLQKAKTVYVLTVGRVDDACPTPQDLAGYLQRHGVAPQVLEVEPDKDGIENQLAAQVNTVNADLLVMGAYTHSRLQELIFGGVTRHMLKDAHIPVFMAH